MCLAAIAVAQSPRFPWVLASNRDEFFQLETREEIQLAAVLSALAMLRERMT